MLSELFSELNIEYIFIMIWVLICFSLIMYIIICNNKQYMIIKKNGFSSNIFSRKYML